MSSANKAQAQSSAKRMQLSRDQKALLETVYAMEKLPQLVWPVLYTSYAAAPDFLADHRLEPTLQRDPTPAGLQ